MIFSKFFKPKYQDPDPKVRIEAITQLSSDVAEQKSQLHELAFNDEDAGVSLAALEKLNSFALWSKMADIAKQERVRKKAQQKLEMAILGKSELVMSDKDRRTYILESKNTPLLEKLLKQGSLDEDLQINILKKLDKPALFRQTFFSTDNKTIQQALLAEFEDEATLNKVLKRVLDEDLLATARHKLDKLQQQKEKPLAVEKQTSMVLSKLLALKEKNALPEIESQRRSLSEEYQQLSAEFTCLSLIKSQEFDAKYQDIIKKLDAWQDQLAPIWQEQKQRQAFEEALETLSHASNALFKELDLVLGGDIAAITLGQVESFEQRLQELLKRLQALSHDGHRDAQKTIEVLFNRLHGSQSALQSLPEFQQAIEQAKEFLKTFSELDVPNDFSQLEAATAFLNEQKQQWKAITRAYQQNWPKELSQSWKTLEKGWFDAIQTLQSQLKQDVAKCRSKLKAIDSLVEQGKYKSAMGLYRKVSGWIEQLPDGQAASLQRAFSKATEQIENLRDWQSYIAEPRKPELLQQAEALVKQPLVAEEQSKAVKKLRQEWNSLGTTDQESDLALNAAFDDAIEKAFEVCRVHFAKQQQIREQNLANKHRLLGELQAKVEAGLPLVELQKHFRSWQKNWQNIGDVDFKQLDELNQKYQRLTQPLKEKLSSFQQDNAEQKRRLIEKAKGLLDLEDPFDAANQAKALQEAWKSIEHAGRKNEGQLWDKFRAVNDQVFARRTQVQEVKQQALDEQVAEIEGQLTAMRSAIEQAQEKGELMHALDALDGIRAGITSLPKNLAVKLEKKLSQQLALQREKLSDLTTRQKQSQMASLFDVLQAWTESAEPTQLEVLPTAWQQWFKQPIEEDEVSRHALTVMLEILKETDSPESDSQLRSQLQLSMMADKLSKGDKHSTANLLQRWIKKGPLIENDQNLLARIQRLNLSL